MKLHFFGSAAPLILQWEIHLPGLRWTGLLFLVDCGETVYELLMKRSNLREYRQIYVYPAEKSEG